MPLTRKGEEILAHLKGEYGPARGTRVFYASARKGTITGVERGAGRRGGRRKRAMTKHDGFHEAFGIRPAKKKKRKAKRKTTKAHAAKRAHKPRKKSHAKRRSPAPRRGGGHTKRRAAAKKRKGAKRKSAKRRSAKKRAKLRRGGRSCESALRAARRELRAFRERGSVPPALIRARGQPAEPTAPVLRVEDAIRAALAAGDLPRFGRFKVFIAPLVQRVQRRTGASREAVRAALLAMHRAGQLTLARADLTTAMDPALVRESEIPYLNATFHFVDVE